MCLVAGENCEFGGILDHTPTTRSTLPLVATELEDMKLLLSSDARSYPDFDQDLADDAEETLEALGELRKIFPTLFPARPCHFALNYHDLSLTNILVDPATYQITGIVDWESVGTRLCWENICPVFLVGPEFEGEVKLPIPGDLDDVHLRVERWEGWEKMKLRPVFVRELGGARRGHNAEDEIRREFRNHMDWARLSLKEVKDWVEGV